MPAGVIFNLDGGYLICTTYTKLAEHRAQASVFSNRARSNQAGLPGCRCARERRAARPIGACDSTTPPSSEQHPPLSSPPSVEGRARPSEWTSQLAPSGAISTGLGGVLGMCTPFVIGVTIRFTTSS